MEGLGNRLSRIEAALPSLLERFDELHGSVDRHAESIAELRAGLADLPAGGGADDRRLDAVAATLVDVQSRLDALREQAADTGGYDAIAGRIDELHEQLLGADGLRAQIAGLPGADDTDVEDVVARAVAESERRLADHIDEAVLALAEVLLRRRPRGAGSAPAVPAVPSVPAPAVAPPVDQSADEDDEDYQEDDAELEDELDGALDGESETAEDEDDEDDGGDADAAPPAAPSTARWQTPVAPATEVEAEVADAAEPTSGRRKPWWRPGG